jgi:DNA-directed RNA polymerase specialized sigma24 family protein
MDGGDKGKDSDTGNLSEEEYLREFLKNLQLTKHWLRKRYGDRILGMMGFDDFLQEAAIAIWRNRSDPKFMRRKAGLQQKTFYAKKYYKHDRMLPISCLDTSDNTQKSHHQKMEDVIFVDTHEEPLAVSCEDWESLREKYNLRPVDITMLKMKCEGKSTEEISKVAGIAVNSVHVRISDLKRRIMDARKEEENP